MLLYVIILPVFYYNLAYVIYKIHNLIKNTVNYHKLIYIYIYICIIWGRRQGAKPLGSAAV